MSIDIDIDICFRVHSEPGQCTVKLLSEFTKLFDYHNCYGIGCFPKILFSYQIENILEEVLGLARLEFNEKGVIRSSS